jgi:hypothetical protein
VVTLIRPASWAFGLLGFLAGGGLAIVAWPILVLPTPTGLQNDLGGPVSRVVLGGPSAGIVLLIGAVAVVAIGGIVLLTWLGAWAERQGIGVALEAAAEEGFGPAGPVLDGAPGPGRITLVRLASLLPLVVAGMLAWGPVYDATYRELILPDDLVTPLPLRVIRDVPGVLLGLLVVWLVSDAAAAFGVRRLVPAREPVLRAILLGWLDVLRRPHVAVAAWVVGTGVLALVTAPVLLATGSGWERVRGLLMEGRDRLAIGAAIAVWVGTWLGGLALIGVATAFRAALWTFIAARRQP